MLFCTFVLLDQLPDNPTQVIVEELLNNKIHKFDIEFESIPFFRECWCIGSDAADKINQSYDFQKELDVYLKNNVSKEMHDFYESGILHRLFIGKKKKEPIKYNGNKFNYNEVMDLYNDLRNDFKYSFEKKKELEWENHPNRYSIDTDCKHCIGDGILKCDYNKNGKFDWWRIGGRWNGLIIGSHSEDDGINSLNMNEGEEYEKYEDNLSTVQELLERLKNGDDPTDCIPFAILDSNGNWHDRREDSLRFYRVKPVKEWVDFCIELLEENANCIAIACDMHTT